MCPINENDPARKQQKFNRSVSCLCWAYNEELLVCEFLTRLNNLLQSTVEDYEIVIVDDKSTDRTKSIILEMQKTIPQIVLVANERNMNVGYCTRHAIQNAKKDFLFWQTIDWSYDISQLRFFFELLNAFDVVAGVRRQPVLKTNALHKRLLSFFNVFGIRHITKRSDTIPKALVSLINYFLIRLLFQVPISDYQNVVFYPTKWVRAVIAEARSSFANPELLIKAYWSGMKIKEVPISFIPRAKGEAKGTRLAAIMSSIKDIFRLWFKWVVLGDHVYTKRGSVVRCNQEGV